MISDSSSGSSKISLENSHILESKPVKEKVMEWMSTSAMEKHKDTETTIMDKAKPDDTYSEVIPYNTSINLSVITICTTSTHDKKQKWDKRHACKYCEKLYPKIARHLEDKHSNEIEVGRALAFPKKSKERKLMWDIIRNDGDWDHNFNVLKKNKGTLIPKYRTGNQTVKAPSKYVPCSSCKALYNTKMLNQHQKTCKFHDSKKDTVKRNQAVRDGRMLLPIPNHATDSFYSNVLLSMEQDDVYNIISSDTLVLQFGKRMWENREIQEHTANTLSNRMRNLGRLIKKARETDGSNIFHLEDCLNPQNFQSLVKCVKLLAGFSVEDHTYQTPSLALKIGYSLMRCARILKADGIIEHCKEKKTMAEDFLDLYQSNWNDMISCRARQTQADQKYNNPKMLPLCEDIYKLNCYLKTQIKYFTDHLFEDISLYPKFSQFVLCQLTLFNRKRGGDAQRIKVDTYEKAMSVQKNLVLDDEVKSSLSALEVKLCETMSRIEIKGKFERKVAILITDEMKVSINYLIKYRKESGVIGQYLFSRPFPSTRPYRASDVISNISKDIGLKYPDAITFTNLRKHIATMAQVHELGEEGQDQLARFLGHDIRVHREIYRQPLDLMQKAKISKMLFRVNDGKTADEVTINEEDEIDTNEIEKTRKATISDSQSEISDVSMKTVKKKVTKRKKLPSKSKQTVERKKWSGDEMACIHKHFQAFIHLLKVPGKNDIEKVIVKEPALNHRAWRNIKDCVHNLIMKKKKAGN